MPTQSEVADDKFLHRAVEHIAFRGLARLSMMAAGPLTGLAVWFLQGYFADTKTSFISVNVELKELNKTVNEMKTELAVATSTNKLLHSGINTKNEEQDRRLDNHEHRLGVDEQAIGNHEQRIKQLESKP